MSKNIVIFSDGTGQAGGLKPDQALSNVYKLFRAARSGPDNSVDPAAQVAFYDAGLGTENDEGSIPIRPIKLYRKALSGATGTGISRNIADCYEAILKHYEPGDRIFLFGFSRGAYTARCVGGVLSFCGVPTQAADGGPLPRFGSALRRIADEAVKNVYEHGSGKSEKKYADERTEQARRFREKYGCDLDGKSNTVPYFIGVFDTVAAVGSAGLFRWVIITVLLLLLAGLAAIAAFVLSRIPGIGFWWAAAGLLALGMVWVSVMLFRENLKVIRHFPSRGDRSWHFVYSRLNFYNTFLSKRVLYARHALAIDEERENFPRVPWTVDGELVRHPDGQPEWLRQVWFAGNHSDIGGSYPEDESRLSDVALLWMVEEATRVPNGLLLDQSKLRLYPAASGMQHCEISSMRDRYWSWIPDAWRRVWPKQQRPVSSDAKLHPSVLERFGLQGIYRYGVKQRYRPSNLKDHIDVQPFYLTHGPVDVGTDSTVCASPSTTTQPLPTAVVAGK
jgi:uncharacterized protein (DUF2235 family)